MAILGIKEQKGEVKSEKTTDVRREFLGKTEKHQHLIRNLCYYKINKNDKNPIVAFDKFFNEKPMTKLSNSAYDEFNQFARGGFEFLVENIDQPSDLETFLLDYLNLLER